jgi:hypothetical protein
LFPPTKPQEVSECLVFHDEHKDQLWAHCLLFVPLKEIDRLYKVLYRIRQQYDCSNKKLHFCDISGSKFCKEDGSYAIREWIFVAVDAMRSKNTIVFKPPLKCKMGVIFFPPPSKANINFYKADTKKENILRYFENVLKMMLKGCAHFLYSSSEKLIIKGLVTDGNPWRRPLSKTRILDALRRELRDYIEIAPDAVIEALNSDHDAPDCTDPIKANILQLTDLLLGSVIEVCYQQPNQRPKRWQIAQPVKEMLDKRKRGSNFQYSGHYKSFALTIALPRKRGGWDFDSLETKEIIYDPTTGQLTLEDLQIEEADM